MLHFCKKPVDFRDPNFGIAGVECHLSHFVCWLQEWRQTRTTCLLQLHTALGPNGAWVEASQGGSKNLLKWGLCHRCPSSKAFGPHVQDFYNVWMRSTICSCSTMQIIKNEVLSFCNQCNCWSWETMMLCWMPFDLSSSPAGFSPCSTAFAACMHGPESYCIPLPQIIGHVCIYTYNICIYIYSYMY